MKIKVTLPLFALLITVIVSSTQAQPAGKKFTLDGIVNTGNDRLIYIEYAYRKEEYRTDSAAIEHGHFHFNGPVEGPTAAFLTTDKKLLPDDDKPINSATGKNTVLFFLEPAAMQVTLDTADFRYATFSGSHAQEEFTAFSKQAKTQDALSEFMGRYPGSYVSAWLLTWHHFPLDTLRHYYYAFPGKLQHSAYGKAILKDIQRKELVAVGKRAPSFDQQDRNGKSISLKDFRGNYVLLQFWASWNTASKMENEQLLQAYNRYKNKNFTIIGASIDGQKTRGLWSAAVAGGKLPWIQLMALKTAHNPVALKYDVETIPANFLIDPAGRIIANDLNGEGLQKKLALIFSN
ncbi:MAG TPA: TlpA disulfide reductase family protein [Puia sp.]|nr:TlpA disulfide reductase family protein [Puia sp.]